MTLQDYIAINQSKYAVIGSANYNSDPMAQSISSSPRRFTIDDTEYVILSLDPALIAGLVEYIQISGSGIEFEFIKGTGNVSLLQHQQALDLLATLEQVE